MTKKTRQAPHAIVGQWSRFLLAYSRLRDGGGKSFSKKKYEKRVGAGERKGGGACMHFFNSLFWYISSWYTLWLVNCDS